MPEDQNHKPQDESPQRVPAKPGKRRRRRWPWVLLSLLIVLSLLVVFAPGIASTAPVRALVIGQINNRLNGSVEVADWSISWTSGIRVRGIRVFDDQKRLILDVPLANIGLSLIGAARSNFALADPSEIEIDSFVLNVDQNGRTNFEKLIKTAAPSGASELDTANAKPAPAPPAQLPQVAGKIAIHFRGTIEGAAVPAPVHVDRSSVVVSVADINKPIETVMKLAYRVGDGATSTIESAGTFLAVQNNTLNTDKLQVAQKLVLSAVNLAAAEPLLKGLGPETKLAGVANGELDVKLDGLSGTSAAGQIVVSDLLFAGGPLGADRFQTSRLCIPVSVTRTVVDADTTLIKIEKLGAETPQATVSVVGELPEQAIKNLAAQKPPGAQGKIDVIVAVTDLADLANQLKHTLQLGPDVVITGGMVRQELSIGLAEDRVRVSQKLNAAAKGTKAGSVVQLQPVLLDFAVAAIPTGKLIPDIRDVEIAVDSVFAQARGGGQSLAKLSVAGSFDLAKLRAELAQFIDLQNIQLEGTGDFAVSSEGDPTDINTPILASGKLNLQNVKISGLTDQRIEQDRLTVSASGKLRRQTNEFNFVAIDSASVEIVGGDPASPMLDLAATADIDLSNPNAVKLPAFELTRAAVRDVANLQQRFGVFVPVLAEQQIKLESGAVYAKLAGTFDGTTLALTKPVSISLASLTITKAGRPVVRRETVRASIDGTVALPADTVSVNLTSLSLASQSNLFDVAKAGDAPLVVRLDKTGAIRGSGAIALSADLHRLNRMAQALAGRTADKDELALRSGQFSGTISLSRADKPETAVNFDGRFSSLTIARGGKNALENENLTIALKALVPDDPKTAAASVAGKVGSSFVSATLDDLKLSLAGGLWQTVQSASVQASVPDIPKLHALVNALAPAAETGEPLRLAGGSAVIRMNVARDATANTTKLNVTDCQVSNLGLLRGKRVYRFDPDRPIALKLAAAVNAADDPARPIAQQIRSISVSELSGDLRVASLSMPSPITITDPLGTMAVAGSVRLDGAIEAAAPLLAVLQDADPLPYAGQYQLAQQVVTRADNVLLLNGTIDVNQFKVLAESREPLFTEDQIAIRNSLDVDPKNRKVLVKTLTLDMPRSQALGLSLVGGLNDWQDKREIRQGTKLDLTYDLAKIWTIVYPMLTQQQRESYKDVRIAGKFQRSFVLSGALPAAPSPAESIKSLRVDGGIAIEMLDAMGLHVTALELPLTLKGGLLRIADAQGRLPKPAAANGGTLNLGGITLDLSSADPLLTVPLKKDVLKNVALNPVLARSLGKLGAVVFSEATRAEGQLTVTVVECNRVPLGGLIQKKQDARAQIVLTVSNLQLDGVVPQVISAAADLGTGGIHGSIPPSSITLGNGLAKSDLTILLNRRVKDQRTGREVEKGFPLKFTGALGMERLDLRDFVVNIPPELLLRDLRKIFPNGAVLPLEGTADSPRLDLQKAVGDNIGNTLMGGKEGGNPLDGVLRQLGGQDKDKGKEGGGRKKSP